MQPKENPKNQNSKKNMERKNLKNSKAPKKTRITTKKTNSPKMTGK